MTVELPMVQVTVHPDGALVVRRGWADLAAGPVRVGRLPLLLDPGSVRVGVQGGTLVQARLDLDLPGMDGRSEVQEEAALADVERRILLHDAEVAHLQRAQQFARGLQPRYDTEGPALTAAGLASWVQLDAASTSWSERLDARLSVLSHTRDELIEERKRLQSALAALSTAGIWHRWAPTRCLALDIRDPDAADGRIELEVSYRIPGARWVPTYTLDLDRNLQGGRFAMRAMVAQATGEDWNDVSIALSTAPSARIVDLPELHALRLGTVQPPPQTGWRPLPADLDSLFPHQPPPPPPEVEPEPQVENFGAGGAPERAVKRKVASALPAPMPPPSMAGPPGAPMPSRAAPMMARSLVGGSSADTAPPVQKPRPGALQAGNEQLDYANLRVHGSEAGRGRQGRLYALDAAAGFRDRELPPDAWARWSNALSRLVDGTHELLARPLPTHQVVPGPVDGADARFDAEGSVSIPSDSRFHTATLFTEPATAKVTYRAVPRADPRVFRQVEARTTRTGALPPGPLEASIAGALEIVAPFGGSTGADAVRFGLGAEDNITIVRNVRYDEQSAGLLGGSRRFSTHIEVEAASALDRAVRIELLERIPVPVESDSPAFQITEASPPSEPYEGEPGAAVLEGGRRQWMQLEPGGTAKARLSYAVTLSNKEELAGGDRRG